MTVTRRTFTRAGGAILLAISGAGCLSSQRGVADVVIHNLTAATKTVSMKISGLDKDDIQFQKTITLDPKSQKLFNNKVVMSTDNLVEVDIKGGQRDTWKWKNVSNTIHIILHGDKITHWVED